MTKTKNPDWIADIIIDDIMSLSESELNDELTQQGFDPDKDATKLCEAVKSTSLQLRKKKFINIKSELEEKKKSSQSATDQFINKMLSTGKSAKDYLIDLIVAGQAPGDITMAFRDGKDISEDEAISIIKDLKELGYIKDDESDETNRR